MSRSLKELAATNPISSELATGTVRKLVEQILSEDTFSPLELVNQISMGSGMGTTKNERVDLLISEAVSLFPGDVHVAEIRLLLVHEITIRPRS